MIPPRFEYFAPRALDEALSLLQKLGPEAKILSGGQSLIPMMKLRLASPPRARLRKLTDVAVEALFERLDQTLPSSNKFQHVLSTHAIRKTSLTSIWRLR